MLCDSPKPLFLPLLVFSVLQMQVESSYSEQGVVVSVILRAPAATLHEPIIADLFVDNGLDEEVTVDLGHNRKSNLAFTIAKGDGPAIPLPKLSEDGFGAMGIITLLPTEQYHQALLLDEWYRFESVGAYRIEVHLSEPVRTQSGRLVMAQGSQALPLQIRSRDADRLAEVCRRLARAATEPSNVVVATEAAQALSYVRDPVAVPYLQSVLTNGRLVRPYAVVGLGWVANHEAIGILIAALNGEDAELDSLVRRTLTRIHEDERDPAVKKQIAVALGAES